MELDWVVISGLATAVGTFVLALATFWSVRSANRAARVAEETLLASVRPLLMPSRQEDAPLKVGFGDDHFVRVAGGGATAEVSEEAIYLTASVRNAGSGIAVLHGWRVETSAELGRSDRPDLESFRRLTRDIYIAAGDHGFWQGAIRERTDPLWDVTAEHINARERLVIDILYGDHHGGQRVISRFGLWPRAEDGQWLASVLRHWNVDRPQPR